MYLTYAAECSEFPKSSIQASLHRSICGAEVLTIHQCHPKKIGHYIDPTNVVFLLQIESIMRKHHEV